MSFFIPKSPRGNKKDNADEKVLVVEVLEARKLRANEDGTANPYVTVFCGTKKKHTKKIMSTLSPVWELGSARERFIFKSKAYAKAKSIVLKCMDWSQFHQEHIGVVDIPLSSFTDSHKDEWFTLQPLKAGEIVSGDLHVKYYSTSISSFGGNSPLWDAVKRANLSVATELAKKPGTNVNERGEGGQSLLHVASSYQEPINEAPAILLLLLQQGADISQIDDSGNTAFQNFCKFWKSPQVEAVFKGFIDKGVNVNATNFHGETALHQSLLNSSPKSTIGKLLLDNNANPNIQSTTGDTALHYAVHMGRVDYAKLLIGKGAKVDIANKRGETPSSISRVPDITEFIKESEELHKWLKTNGMEKYTKDFLEEQIFVGLLSDVSVKWLSEHMNKADMDKFLAIPKEKRSARVKPQQNNEKSSAIQNILKEKVLEWELDIEDIEFEKQLGEGTSGTVFKGLYHGKDNVRTVAIKVLKPTNTEKEITEFVAEFTVMVKTRSPYTVQFYGATLKNKLCMVMEFCDRGSLYDLLQNDKIDITWKLAFEMQKDIVKGLLCLHNNQPPIFHRDLKSLNVLVTTDFKCRLADFGLTRFDTTSNLATLGKCRGTYAYIAPEGIDEKSFKYTIKADIYSLAIIMWEFANRCVTGVYKRPFYDIQNVVSEFTFLLQAARNNRRPKMPEKIPPSLSKLITDSWHKDPNIRPDAKTVLSQIESIHEDYQKHAATWDAIPPPPKPKKEDD